MFVFVDLYLTITYNAQKQMTRKIDRVQETKNENRFIGVAWPYVNGELHIGHLSGYLLPADIFARFSRVTGHDVLMVSGSDCFGTPITVEADKKKVSPKEIVEIYHAKDVRLFRDILDLSYDIYTKTESENHIQVVQDIFLKLISEGLIFIDSTKQYYSPKEKRFLPDRYIEGTCENCGFSEARSDQCDQCGKMPEKGDLKNPKSKLSGGIVELRDTQHYFLDWPKLQIKIEKYVKSVGPNWKKWVYQETLGWLETGLKPRAISRDLDWGIPIPADRMSKDMVIDNLEHKRLYVWFDAVIGYLSASILWSKESGKNWELFWKNPEAKHYYFMGKDNLVFHTIFWPGQLMGYDSTLNLPDIPSINMFLSLDGKQFSKSRGVSIPIEEIVQKYGNDAVRFYLTLIMPETKDSNFTWEDFYNKNNTILVGNFGNFIHRVLSIAQSIDFKGIHKVELHKSTQKEIQKAFVKSREHLDKCEFRDYLGVVLSLSSYGNKYMTNEKIWELKKNNPIKFNDVLKQLYAIILSLGYLTLPLMPSTANRIFNMIGIENDNLWPMLGDEVNKIESLLKDTTNDIKPSILFNKIGSLLQEKSE